MKYFAYGSNMNKKRMRSRSIRFSKRGRAILEGYKLVFNKRAQDNDRKGYANIVKDKDSYVEGVLYEIVSEDIKKLDCHEGYPNHYDRCTVRVRLDDGEIVDAVTYIANKNMIAEGLRPSREYISHLLEACDILSPEYCEMLRNVETIK